MINKMVQKYLGRKGYVAVKRSTIDYAAHIMDIAVEEIVRYGENDGSIQIKLIGDIIAAKNRLEYYRLE